VEVQIDDGSKILSVENAKHIDVVGTAYRGTVKATYAELVKMFGKPTYEGGDKVSVSWSLEFEVEEPDGIELGEPDYDYVIATVYDWKEPSTPTGEYDWHIGAKRRDGMRPVWLVNDYVAHARKV
jgi:hypothetical protein|tara:strand:- start:5042 stop:5416 length:375 start_codon:yes stop_codon:yes gene_type:complete